MVSGVERMLTEPISQRLWPGLLGAQHDHSTRCGPRDVACDGSRITDHWRRPVSAPTTGDGVPGVVKTLAVEIPAGRRIRCKW
jgi:hypothetical protein